MEGQKARSSWYFNVLHLDRPNQNKLLGETQIPIRERRPDVALSCIFCCGSHAWMLREWLSESRSGSFLVFVPLPASTHWDRWAPQRLQKRRMVGGVLPKCLHMVWVLLILLYSLRHRTHDLLRHCEDEYWQPALQPHKATTHTWMRVRVWDVPLIESDKTKRGLPWPCLTRRDSANRCGQTVISHLTAWKNGDHLTRKRQDFWTFNLPSPTTSLCHRNDCGHISWHAKRHTARTVKTQWSYWKTYGNNPV